MERKMGIGITTGKMKQIQVTCAAISPLIWAISANNTAFCSSAI